MKIETFLYHPVPKKEADLVKLVFKILLCPLLFFTVAFTAPAQAIEETVTTPLVLSVEVTGNQHINEDTILRVVTNIRLGEPLDQEAVKKDLNAINQLGYFSAVDAHTEPFIGGVKLVFEVHENPVFQKFEIIGLKKADPEEIIKHFTQKQGEIINYAQIREDLSTAITKYQQEKGLVLTVLEKQTAISADGVVTLHMTEVKLGKIKIEGLEKTKETVVTRELTMQENELFDMNKLRYDYQRLTRLQLFKEIRPLPQPTSDPEVMDLLLEFEEGQTAQFNFGITYTPKSSQLAGFVSVMEPNLIGLGQRISFNVEMNPEDFYHLSFEFYEPWLDDKQTSFGLTMYANYDFDLDGDDYGFGNFNYDEKGTGLELSLGRPLAHDLRVDTSLQFEKVEIDPQGNLLASVALPVDNEYWDNSFGIGLVQDKRELANIFYSVDGYWAKLSTSLHGRYLGGEYDYQQYLAEYKQFISPWQYTTFAYRVKGGTMVGEVPVTGKFEIGGPMSLRGYSTGVFEGTDLFLANLELRQRFSANENVELVAFYDVGSVDREEFNYGYGIGVRYIVPFLGQLRLDFAWDQEGEQKTHFFISEMF